jgi:citrate synthase
MTWLTAEQALILLGTKSQTLYANVSRGRIRAKPDPSDTRRSLYFGEDVNKLAARHPGRRKSEAVAEEAIRWGDPVLSSALSTRCRPALRGLDAGRRCLPAVGYEATSTVEWKGLTDG